MSGARAAVFAGIATIAVLGYLLLRLFDALRRWLLRWRGDHDRALTWPLSALSTAEARQSLGLRAA